MQTAINLLPNHFPGIYGEMKGAVESRIFEVDFKGFIKKMYEACILEEFNHDIIGVEEYERSQERRNSRNGFYQRNLDTVYGWIQEIQIPRPRKGGFSPRCLKKFGRRELALERLVRECYVRGISTRDVSWITESLADIPLSSATVSRLTDEWLVEVKRWHERKLPDDYIYLMLDGVWIKNRYMGGKRRLILVAYGIKSDGVREIIDYRFAQSESESCWLKFLTNLSYRGLEGKQLKLITTDGCHGLGNALEIVYPTTPHQLCWAHKMRNILQYVKEKDKTEVNQGLRHLFSGEWTVKKATTLINSWRRRWYKRYPQAVRCLERNMEHMLLYLDCPGEHHKAIRTSNHIERQFKEYRRRMKPMEMTPTLLSADKILFALTMVRNDKLKEYPLLFTHKTLH